MLPRKARRQADVVVSTLMILFGLFVIYRASLMPWESQRTGGSVQWYLSPGLFPVVIGLLLIAFNLRVLTTALREGGHKGLVGTFLAWLRGLPGNRRIHRVVFMAAWIAAYIFLGVGNFNFQALSAVFLFVFICVFWLPGAGPRLLPRAGIAAIVSVAVPAFVSFVFSHFLYVPAP